MSTRLHTMLLTTVVVTGLAGLALAQDVQRLKYDVEIESALRMGSSTYVLPPGQYVLEQFDDKAPNLFALRKKAHDAPAGDVLAILDAWRVPFFDGMKTSGIKMRTRPESDGIPVILGWQIGSEYWRLRDAVALDEEALTATE